jgi:serine/threonine protein kinase
MALTTGTRLGPFEIISPLGAGGMGEVYRAKDTRLDRTVAIKPSRFSPRIFPLTTRPEWPGILNGMRRRNLKKLQLKSGS